MGMRNMAKRKAGGEMGAYYAYRMRRWEVIA